MRGLHQLDHSQDDAIAELRGCLPDAMKLEFVLTPELARTLVASDTQHQGLRDPGAVTWVSAGGDG